MAAPFPEAILVVDRPPILEIFGRSKASVPFGLAVVCIDGTPSRLVAALKRGFRAGHRAAILYVHDAATVIYPFAIEPLATLLKHRGSEPIVYRDLGLPPLGANPRRFRDPMLPTADPIFHLEAIPAAALVRYCVESARRLVRAAAIAATSTLSDRGDRRRAR